MHHFLYLVFGPHLCRCLLLLPSSQDGGAIYQERWATFVFNSFATFQENAAWNVRWSLWSLYMQHAKQSRVSLVLTQAAREKVSSILSYDKNAGGINTVALNVSSVFFTNRKIPFLYVHKWESQKMGTPLCRYSIRCFTRCLPPVGATAGEASTSRVQAVAVPSAVGNFYITK